MRYETKDIILTPLISEKPLSDWYREWFLDKDVTKYTSHRAYPLTIQKEKEFISSLNSPTRIVWQIVTKDSKWLGNASLDQIDMLNRKAEFTILIGDKNYWGKGVGTTVGKILLYHAFIVLGLNSVWGGCAEPNIGMREIFAKLNMKQDGEFPQALWIEGKFVDIYHYTILKDQYIKNYEGEPFVKQGNKND